MCTPVSLRRSANDWSTVLTLPLRRAAVYSAAVPGGRQRELMRAGAVWLPKAVWNSPRRLPSTRRQTTDTPCKRRISLPRVVRGGGGEEEEGGGGGGGFIRIQRFYTDLSARQTVREQERESKSERAREREGEKYLRERQQIRVHTRVQHTCT